jgi:hypothetical protein
VIKEAAYSMNTVSGTLSREFECEEAMDDILSAPSPDGGSLTDAHGSVDFLDHIQVMLLRERTYMPDPAYMETRQAFTLRRSWRRKIVEWFLSFVEEFNIHGSTIYVALNFLDRYLSRVVCNSQTLETLSMICIFAASKLLESSPIRLVEICNMCSRGSLTPDSIYSMEMHLYHTLDWNLKPSSPHEFVLRFLTGLKADYAPSLLTHTDAFLDIAIIEYDMLQYLPSVMAVAAIRCAHAYLGLPLDAWVSSMSRIRSCTGEDVDRCVDMLIQCFGMIYPNHEMLSAARPISPNSVFDLVPGVATVTRGCATSSARTALAPPPAVAASPSPVMTANGLHHGATSKSLYGSPIAPSVNVLTKHAYPAVDVGQSRDISPATLTSSHNSKTGEPIRPLAVLHYGNAVGVNSHQTR